MCIRDSFYSIFVGLFIHRELTFGGIRHSLQITSWMTGRVLIIMFTAYAFERLLVQYRIPDMIVEHILGFTSDVAVIWMFVIALLLFLGMFMETLAIILLATPVLLPVMTAFGVDPIHFGVVLVCCCGVGFSTPPLGEKDVYKRQPLPQGSVSFRQPMREAVAELERNMIMTALTETGSTYKAARRLKVSQSTIVRKAQRYKIGLVEIAHK